MGSDIEDRKHVGVIQSSRGPGLLFKAAQTFRIAREGRWQDFNRDVSPQPRIAGAIDLSHSTRSDGGLDPVRAEFCSRAQHHRTPVTMKRSDSYRVNE